MIDKSAEEIQDINLTSGEISHSIVLALKRQNLVLGAMTHSMVKAKKWFHVSHIPLPCCFLTVQQNWYAS